MDKPIRLSYTQPDGVKYTVIIDNEEQSEEEFDKMFSTCGHRVLYSVDDVEHGTVEVTPHYDELMWKAMFCIDG